MSHLDGNVLAGPLMEVFRVDMTMASGECAGCHDRSVLAEAMVYVDAPAWIVRCHVCDDVLLTIAHVTGGMRFDLRGLTALDIPAS
jgi:ribosomal protein S27E